MDWATLRNDIKECTKCSLCKTRKNVVIGRGSGEPIVVFVGEAPGESEDKKGMPFVGRAGQLLDSEILRIGLSYNEYFICNEVKCRPLSQYGNNRKPTDSEVNACIGFLAEQINLLKPKVVVMLGATAKQAFYTCGADTVEYCLEFIHPAYVLRKWKMYQVFKRQFDKLNERMVEIRDEWQTHTVF